MVEEPHHTSDLQQTSFLLILAAVSLLLVVIVWPFFTALLWSALAAIMFQPLYRWSLRKCRGKRNPAAFLSLTIIMFAVLLPAFWIGTIVIAETLGVVSWFRANPIDIVAWANSIFASLPETVRQTIIDNGWNDVGTLQERLQGYIGEAVTFIGGQAFSIGSGALSFVLAFGVGLYVTYFLLRDGSRIGEAILHSAPVERAIADRLAERFLGIVRATIKGTVVVGLVQGTVGGLTLWLAGVGSALLLGVVMAILSLIPVLGTGLVWVPAGIWLIVSGEVWAGLFVLGVGFVIISSIDNVLRPILVGRDTGIPDWIILVTTLGGLSIAGFSGIVLGPLVAGLFLASWSILQEQRAEDEEAAAAYRTKVGADGKVPEAGSDKAPAPVPGRKARATKAQTKGA
ncbi:MAG: AI-2E family transporter [Pseudomonadota bacterium]